MVWWSLSSAFFFMLFLVLATNIFADSVRDAFDPKPMIKKMKLTQKINQLISFLR